MVVKKLRGCYEEDEDADREAAEEEEENASDR